MISNKTSILEDGPFHISYIAIILLCLVFIISWYTGRTDINQLRKQIETNIQNERVIYDIGE